MTERGQAIVEFALVFPLLLFLLEAIIAVAYFGLRTNAWQNGVEVLAELAATDPGWRAHVNEVDERVRCNGGTPTEERTDHGSLILRWTCRDGLWTYFARIVNWPTDITVEHEQFVGSPAPTPGPT